MKNNFEIFECLLNEVLFMGGIYCFLKYFIKLELVILFSSVYLLNMLSNLVNGFCKFSYWFMLIVVYYFLDNNWGFCYWLFFY